MASQRSHQQNLECEIFHRTNCSLSSAINCKGEKNEGVKSMDWKRLERRQINAKKKFFLNACLDPDLKKKPVENNIWENQGNFNAGWLSDDTKESLKILDVVRWL